ncbi:UNVERIFIED_CONTAM: Cannabidiolic acid synthase-like 1 [Sesamum calycinum]|uniref:Cannabidiolic acid synthase-like 1 n=1 Tax=Sesamum calycinum TaxID=2727403 RepID=A0AAW2IXS7_9LAMI
MVLGVSSTQDHNKPFLECLIDQFQSSNADPSNVVYSPNNASYASLLLAPNLRPESTSPLRPLLIVTPYYEREIQAVIYCCKKLGTQIRVRSGGHDYEGLSYVSGIPFVILDMRNFRSVSINTNDKTAWVEVGTTLGQLYHTIARHSKNLAFTAGVCPTVGVGGHISGGGYGMMSRKHSIAADHIIDAKVMNADGHIVDRRSMGLRNESFDILLSRIPTGIYSPVYFKGKSDYLSPYGGALNDYSECETPFAHRAGYIFMIHYAVSWTSPGNSESERHMNWIRRLYGYMAPYVSKNPRAAYFNYRDLDLGTNKEGNTSYAQATVWGLKYFGNNFNRLVVKTKIDPSNFFRNEQSVPPLYVSARTKEFIADDHEV